MQDPQKKKLLSIAVVILIVLLLMGILLGNVLWAAEGKHGIKEVPGLRRVTDVPVDSIPLRHDLPDHPRGPPSETEEASERDDSP